MCLVKLMVFGFINLNNGSYVYYCYSDLTRHYLECIMTFREENLIHTYAAITEKHSTE